ncbi:hypothetical protein Sme01_06230 [Sphaerisporangium melleum]|uniref:Thiopeptide-type bacteriocin biosynthesis domain-containing protein n=1 Tax=Sphaerisporangium melleum TaxID=321316 RepID=A0A917VD02_9ACTN|nr:lantibiotic dehydratase C-terminal domain-containing protein [Sphaerisporangium melleum]GGK63986.1 hypothetical protein GCM10007964_03800 [Sphaerisporangium melleum]GII68147.1 hypothetical protein Sme01_06230 [Sphaerisporangium melleum]
MTDRWVSLHAFHRSGTDLLLGTAVGGLVRELDARLDRFFFLRYWEGGPHLRLRLLPRDPGDAAMIEKRATAVLEAHLAAHPTMATWDRERYALLAEEFARQEGLAGYDRRLRADDQVEAVAYRPEYATFGGPEAVAAVERHFTDSSRIALAILRGEHDHRRRLGHALAAMMLAFMAWEPDPRRLGPLLARERDRWDPAPARARQQEIFAKQREALTAQAERCRHIATRPPSSNTPVPAAHAASSDGPAPVGGPGSSGGPTFTIRSASSDDPVRATSSDGPAPVGGPGSSGDPAFTIRSASSDGPALAALPGSLAPAGRVLQGAGEARDPLGAWWNSIDTLHRRLVALQQAGRFHPLRRKKASPIPGPVDAGPPADEDRYDVLTVLDRCVHLFCNRLGLSIAEEAHLRYLTAVTLDGAAGKEGTS